MCHHISGDDKFGSFLDANRLNTPKLTDINRLALGYRAATGTYAFKSDFRSD